MIDDAERENPLRAPGHQAEMMGATAAAASSMFAVLHRDITREGQWIDVPCWQAIASTSKLEMAAYTYVRKSLQPGPRLNLAHRIDAGFWLEQTLFQTLQTWRALEPQRRKLHFWRDRAGHEVDFILEQDHKLVALEIKTSSQVTSSDTSGIRAFRDSLKQKEALVRGVVLHAGKSRPLEGNDLALPWGWMVPSR